MVINLIVVVGLYTFVGVSGVFSFGHAAFMAIGAYAGAILVIPPETKAFVLPGPARLPGRARTLDPLPATIVAGALAARLRARPLASARPSVRAHRRARDVRRAQHRERRRAQLGAGDARHGRSVRHPHDDHDLGSARLGAASRWRRVGVSAFAQSASGCGPRARTRRPLARSVSPSRASARSRFVLSAFFVGVAGALFGMFIGSFNPDAFFLNITFLMVVMLVIGGTTSLAGAVVGTIVISAVSEILRRIEGGVDLGLRCRSRAKPGLARGRACARDAGHPHLPARRADRRS